MSEPFLGQIGIFGFNFAPIHWAQCNGQVLSIQQNQALFALIGTYYGGNGTTNFALPDLRGRVPLHFGAGFVQGQVGGTEAEVLSAAQMPAHTHTPNCNSAPGAALAPAGNYWAADPHGHLPYAATATSGKQLAAAAIGSQGQGQSHSNLAPFLVVNFCISLAGIFPSRS
jgi:microcystin-dependent protein